MKDSDFVEMVARLLTTAEVEEEGFTPDDGGALDGLIERARDIAAQALAPEGVTATLLFDELGENIMSLKKGAQVIVRQLDIEAPVASIEFRADAIVLDIADLEEGD